MNLKDEKNVDFSSISLQAVKTEIEKINSNTLLHNVIIRNNISIPSFEISRDNTSKITYLSHKIISYSGLKYILSLFRDVSSTVTQKTIEKTLDLTLDTVVSSVDSEKISDISDKIRNEYNLSTQQMDRLDELQKKFCLYLF